MTIAVDWPTQLQPIWTDDLADYVAAIAVMWQQVEQYAADADNDIISWQALLDVDLAPMAALAWLAQCVGDRLPVGLDEPTARNWLKQSPNWNRGTPAAIVDAVKRLLTGTQVVLFRERSRLDLSYDVDCVAVMTYVDETPDVQAVRNALRRNVPADILIEYDTTAASTWAVFVPGSMTWAAFESEYGPTWGNVLSQQPAFNPWA